jgi:hypothetical protein
VVSGVNVRLALCHRTTGGDESVGDSLGSGAAGGAAVSVSDAVSVSASLSVSVSVSVSASVVVTSSVTSSVTASGTGAVRPDVSTAATVATADGDAVGLVDMATQAKATAPSTARGKMGFMKAKGEVSTSWAGQLFHQDLLKSLKFTFGRSDVRGR